MEVLNKLYEQALEDLKTCSRDEIIEKRERLKTLSEIRDFDNLLEGELDERTY